MPKKWIRNRKWERQPHVKDGPPASLWWYRQPDRLVVIDAYVERASRGRALEDDFKKKLLKWLDELSSLQDMRKWGHPGTYRSWSAPSYALAHGLKKATLMKRLRELEKVARQKFPDRVPSGRKKRAPLTEEDKEKIRARYLAGEDAKVLADEFRIPSSQVGRLCQEERKIREAERIVKREAETKERSRAKDQSGGESWPLPGSDDPLG